MSEPSKPPRLRIEAGAKRDADELTELFLEDGEALALRYLDELAAVYRRIENFPEGCWFYEEPVRCCLFPGLLCEALFEIEEDGIWVYVVAHQHEDSKSILKRLHQRRRAPGRREAAREEEPEEGL